MEERYLSIITNFGCHFTCPYCIVKNNNIGVPYTTLESLEQLKSCVETEQATCISVSGGGDPLHNFDKHYDYYIRLFELCEDMNIPLEMHTSYTSSTFPYGRCKRVVYHCRHFKDLLKVRRWASELVRVVFVVTEKFTEQMIDDIARFVDSSDDIDELSFRQMVNSNYQVTDYCQNYLMSGHKKKWWYIEQCDYNTYFVNGRIYRKFEEIGKDLS